MSSNQLRSLMKERQQAKRISHPYARYVGNRLTCTACGGMSVKTEALWASHLTSKSHRVAVQKFQKAKEEEAEAKARESAALKGKRRADEELDGPDGLGEDATKRARLAEYGSDAEEEEDDDGTNGAGAAASGALPAGFFDKPSQAPPPRAGTPEPENTPPAGDEDQEWAAFEATLGEAEPAQAQAGQAFSRATVMAEPVMFDAAGGEAGAGEPEAEEAEEEGPTETDEERRIREEKEEIMDRIETEEREQADADERVNRMKARLDAIRAARQAKAAKKT